MWANYKRLRNDVKFLTRQSYCSYVHDLALNCSSNPKRFWSFVGSQRRQSTITSFETEYGITDDPIRIAHNLNSFFQSNFTNNPDESGHKFRATMKLTVISVLMDFRLIRLKLKSFF